MSDCPEVDEASVRSHMALPGLRKAEADPSHPLKWEEMCIYLRLQKAETPWEFWGLVYEAVLHGWHHHGPWTPGWRSCLLESSDLCSVNEVVAWFPGVLLTTHAPLICVLLPSAAIWSCLPHYRCANGTERCCNTKKQFYNCSLLFLFWRTVH